MTRGNRGRTSLKLRRRTKNPMREFDRLPSELRGWLATAVLPWRPRSVRRAYEKALKRTRDKTEALRDLDKLQDRLIANDVRKVWGEAYPLPGQACSDQGTGGFANTQ